LPMRSDLTNLSKHHSGYYASVREDMFKYIPRGVRRTLEIGCGYGGFSSLLKERLGIECWAVEINQEAAGKASEKLDRVINADAATALADLPDGYFDCVMLFDLLEHLADPYSLLCSLKGKLSATGVIVASIPNIRYYRALVDLVVRGDWEYKDHGILDKSHLRFFTRKSIARMLEDLRFQILTLEGIHPTSSRTYRLLNMVLLGRVSDARWKHFAVVARPRPKGN